MPIVTLAGPSLHGFRKGHSSQTNLIEFWGQVVDWIDEGEPVDVMIYDFAKALDKVEHRRLLVKVRSMGISGKLFRWSFRRRVEKLRGGQKMVFNADKCKFTHLGRTNKGVRDGRNKDESNVAGKGLRGVDIE